MDYTVHGVLQARILEWIVFPSPGDLPNPGIEPRSPSLQADPSPGEPQGKPKNTAMGSLSLLQQVFPTQESNQGLLHYKWIHYPILCPWGFPCGSAGRESACNVGDLGSISGLGRSPGEGKGYPHQYSGLENSMSCMYSPCDRKELDTTERLSQVTNNLK